MTTISLNSARLNMIWRWFSTTPQDNVHSKLYYKAVGEGGGAKSHAPACARSYAGERLLSACRACKVRFRQT